MNTSQPNHSNHGILSKNGFAFFWGGPLSNWYKASFFIDDVLFLTSEHYMMYRKALCCNDMETAEKVLRVKGADKAKRLGREIKNYNEEAWSAERFDAVYEGCLAKFQQNPDLAKILKATAGLELVEASPYDTVWGIGLLAGVPDSLDKKKWRGQNLLGLVLEKVRAELLKE